MEWGGAADACGTENADPMSGTGARIHRIVPSRHDSGRAWVAALPRGTGPGDSPADPVGSGLRLFEDGIELGPPHCEHTEIRARGGGRFSHWQGQLWFSTSDGTSPLENGREYVVHASHGASAELRDLIESFDAAEAYDARRHRLLGRVAELLGSNMVLPDCGRRIDTDDAFKAEFLRFMPNDRSTMDRKYTVFQMAQRIAAVGGDAAEAGCFNGGTAYFMAKRVVESGKVMSLHLFDSFQGLSVPAAIDGKYWGSGDLACDLSVVQENLRDFPFVRYHKGWIPDCFAEARDRRFGFVHIDVDLYQPTRDSLAFFYDRLLPGGVVIFDDYGFGTCPGATRAVDEFMADKSEPIINLASGGAYIVKNG